jgi:tetratricopeptide (TPR) repeat protein
MITAMTFTSNLKAQQLDFAKVKFFEHQLDDVMEIIDTVELKVKLREVEQQFKHEPSEINKIRLGIIYHETALYLSFFSKNEYKGYAQKSFNQLSELYNSESIDINLMPFVASALSLVGAEIKNLKLLGQAFTLFEDAVNKYAKVCYLPEFLRGSVAENLPWFFFTKRKFAKKDMQSIIDKQQKNPQFANWKIMSFAYWAWANQHQGKKDRDQAIAYLDEAIALDTNYNAGRAKAENLLQNIQ